MKRRPCVTIGVLALMIGGCKSVVLDPVGGETETQEDPQGIDPSARSAIAMYASQDSHSPPELPSDELVLFFASEAQECADPWLPAPDGYLSDCGAEAERVPLRWQIVVYVPPHLVHPGVIPLRDPDTVDTDDPVTDAVFFSYWETCSSAGAQNGHPGTLELVSVDATSISVKLDYSADQAHPGINGDYTASFCP